MSDITISVESLAKRYRIGKQVDGSEESASRLRKLVTPLKNSFQYLANTLREPSPEEIIWALNGVSFQVKCGEVLGIIGRNGAGKSTLLKILSRITEPTAGKAQIFGRVGALLEVGTGFHPQLTGRENIFLSGAILGMKGSEIRSKLDEIVAFSGVEQFIDTPIKYYSSGMRVRLGFAVAAHLEPEILLIDEVLAVGDADFQKKCLGKMSEVARGGRTVLFVSHNMAAVQALCTRGIFMQKGAILLDGTAMEAVATYVRTIEQMSQLDLVVRTDRGGKGLMRLVQVEIEDTGDPPSLTLSTGQPARFEFHVEEMAPGMLLEYVDFTIYDLHGRPITYFNSAEHGTQDLRNAGTGNKIVCVIDELLLAPGRYRINVGVKASGDLQDHVEGAAVFNVEEGQVRGRPVLVSGQRLGSVCLPHRWTL
jgi:lipopolysaccharide transport system ATP-binding protein